MKGEDNWLEFQYEHYHTRIHRHEIAAVVGELHVEDSDYKWANLHTISVFLRGGEQVYLCTRYRTQWLEWWGMLQ